jgi:hypothetical protein
VVHALYTKKGVVLVQCDHNGPLTRTARRPDPAMVVVVAGEGAPPAQPQFRHRQGLRKAWAPDLVYVADDNTTSVTTCRKETMLERAYSTG